MRRPARSGKRECARGLAKARRVGGPYARLRGQRGSQLAGSAARPAYIQLPPRRVQRWLAAWAGAGVCTGRVAQEEAREEASGASGSRRCGVRQCRPETTAHRPHTGLDPGGKILRRTYSRVRAQCRLPSKHSEK